jgi:hypothetical protein
MNRRSFSAGRSASCIFVIAAAFLAHCSSAPSPLDGASPTPDPNGTTDGGKGGGGKKDAGPGTTHDGGGPDPVEEDDAVEDEDTGNENDDGGPSNDDCSNWAVGTLTGYDNSNLADDPNAGSVMEYTNLNDAFYDHVPMAAVDMSDWSGDKYHWAEIKFKGKIGRVGIWDACNNADCPDGTNCCTDNKKKFASPGYLLDVETRTATRLWGVSNAEDTLQDKIEYRICGAFDPDTIADQYGATHE